MYTTDSGWPRWVVSAGSLGSLTLLGLVIVGNMDCPAQNPGGKPGNRDAKRVTQMVDDLVNRNKPPKIVTRRLGDYPYRLPVFPKDYDWKEEERVRKAFDTVRQDTSLQLWDELVRRIGDERYCRTTWDESAGDAWDHTVGDECIELAYARLSYVFEEDFPSFQPHGCVIHLRRLLRDLPAWRKARKDKPFYQLQIDVCELVLRELPKFDEKDISAKEKAEGRRKVEAVIKKLRRTQRPIFEEYSRSIEWYDADLADKIRQVIRSGSHADIMLPNAPPDR
jgi:hypothetical protein